MRTPGHWKNINLLSVLLWPFGCLYGLATACRIRSAKPGKVKAKVICIGNLTAGGTGKTPVAISLAAMLQKRGLSPCFITRGYGGTLQDVLVEPQIHTACQVGDEPLLLARQAPVVVNRDRYQGACKAVSNGADYILMDDGFQNPGLYKDLSLLVVDGGFGFGNGMCIPAGPLREFKNQGLSRADAIIIIGEDKFDLAGKFHGLPVFKGRVVPVMPGKKTGKVIAFAGIGRPEKFYQSLREVGFEIVAAHDFPDHHFYTETELSRLIKEAQETGAGLYTTLKDIVKIPARLWPHFNTLDITIEWQNPDDLCEFLIKN